ncbi:MAG: TIGR02452 family protein [Paludibacteraceae bacterium]
MTQRTHLISVFNDTMDCIQANARYRAAVAEAISKQTIVLESEPLAVPPAAFDRPARVIVTHNRTLEAAAQYIEQDTAGELAGGEVSRPCASASPKVCVLNFASATNPGGGVEHGASAQEECICRCSTLYPCLTAPAILDGFYKPHRLSPNPLHNDDIIYTPDVLVLKDDDYHMLPKPFAVDVITCAAPNLRSVPANQDNADGKIQAVISDEELYRLHVQRARRIMTVAANHHAEVLILGAFGCGAFRNNPAIVAKAYNAVLPEFLYHFRTIEFAVYCTYFSQQNYQAFQNLTI